MTDFPPEKFNNTFIRPGVSSVSGHIHEKQKRFDLLLYTTWILLLYFYYLL